MDINDKVARCRLLATLVVADDFVEDVELELLERSMLKLGLDEEEKARVMVLLDEDEALAALDSLSDDERKEFLDDLAEVVWVDDDLDTYEIEQLNKVATAMGFGPDEVQEALDYAEKQRRELQGE
jgi:uncharacterized tellurite resistance protein B-like protein